MKKLYHLKTNGYDLIVSVDKKKNCKYLTETADFPYLADEETARKFLEAVEDDSSWKDDCCYEEIFTDDIEIVAQIEKEL